MALVTTPGASNANAYADRTYVTAYHAERGNAAWTGDDEALDAAIVRSTFAIDGKHRSVYSGTKASGTQSLAWPRTGAVDADGYGFDDDEIPENLKRAVAEGALVELVEPGSLTPVTTPGVKMKREKVDVIEEETQYDGASNLGTLVWTVIDGYLSDLLNGGGSRYSVRVMRG